MLKEASYCLGLSKPLFPHEDLDTTINTVQAEWSGQTLVRYKTHCSGQGDGSAPLSHVPNPIPSS